MMLGALQRHLRPQRLQVDASAAAAAAAEEPLRCIEQRTYYAAPGKLDALHRRFRNHTLELFAKHGITSLGYFSALVDESTNGVLVYYVATASRVQRDAGFAAFAADPEWSGPDGAKTLSEVDGKLVERVESVFLEPTDYSPAITVLGRESQLLELRRYVAAEGKRDALNARFEQGQTTWRRNGLDCLAYLQPTDPSTAPDGEVWVLLAHASQVAASAAYDRLHADPADISFKKHESEQHGAVFRPGGVSSDFFVPTDYSPVLPPTDCVLRHLVCFKFRDDTTDSQKQALVRGFAELQAKIPFIRDFEWGLNSSPEGKDHGFTHCFTLTFSSEADRDAYLPHPAHVEFGRLCGPVEDVFVFDYWALDERWMAAPPRRGALRHMVAYSFAPDTPEQERLTRVGGFAELEHEIATIRSYEWGQNNSTEGKGHGFTHLFCLTFDSEADRDAYLPHPAHIAYGTKHVKAADVVVLDVLID
jgi:hypothetical protein